MFQNNLNCPPPLKVLHNWLLCSNQNATMNYHDSWWRNNRAPKSRVLFCVTLRDSQYYCLAWYSKSGLTLHDFRRTTDQIGCDMSRPVIAGNRGKWLTSGPLRCTISHYTTDFPRLRIISQLTAMSQIFCKCSKWNDGLRYPPIVRIAADRIAGGLTLHDVLSATASWGHRRSS